MTTFLIGFNQLSMAKLRLEAEAGELDENDRTEVNTMLR